VSRSIWDGGRSHHPRHPWAGRSQAWDGRVEAYVAVGEQMEKANIEFSRSVSGRLEFVVRPVLGSYDLVCLPSFPCRPPRFFRNRSPAADPLGVGALIVDKAI
jgi:hypothetical protein